METRDRKQLARVGLSYLAGALACYWAGDEVGTERWLRRVEAVTKELGDRRHG